MCNSTNTLYLKKYIRFRKENQFVFVCDLYNLENYTFPLEYFNDFVKLSEVGMADEPNDFLEDLKTLNMVDYKKDIALNNSNAFSKLSYKESEFFN